MKPLAHIIDLLFNDDKSITLCAWRKNAFFSRQIIGKSFLVVY